MPYVVAGFVAAVLGAAEQHSRLGAPVSLRPKAWFWWLLRVVLEALTAVVILVIARKTQVPGRDSFVGWAAAGVLGPMTFKSRFVDFRTNGEERPYGLAILYYWPRGLIERRLEVVTATNAARHINSELVPRFDEAGIAPTLIADNLKDYVLGLSTKTAEKGRTIRWIDETLAEPTTDAEKRGLLIRRAVELGADDLLDRILGDG
jgi:hypothetical protein